VARKIVIDKTTGKVLRHGFVDFENEDVFDPDTEEVIEMDFDFIPGIDRQDWYYDKENNTFVKG